VVIVYTGSGSPVVIADSYFGMLTVSGTVTAIPTTPTPTVYYNINASASTGGSISPTGTVQVPSGASQTFTITPNTGYSITSVLVDGSSVSSNATYTFTNVTATHTIAASFAINTYTITAAAGTGGAIFPNGSVSVNYSGSQTFTITPNSGYAISGVTVDGTSKGAITSYAFTSVVASHTINATFVAAPTVTGISPALGDHNGGNPVTITGTGFTSSSTVMFGTVAATASFSETGGNQITVNAPKYLPGGTVDVTVTTNGVTSATSAKDQYLYTSGTPTVTSISPATGPAAGGTSVTIYGAGFSTASTVNFGNNAAPSVTFISNTQIIASSPAGMGTVDVTVYTPQGGTSATSANDKYNYGPVITSSSPSSGTKNGGNTVTITGAGFTGATAVSFGGTPAASFTVNSDSQIKAISPAHAPGGPVDITITTPYGTSPTSSNDYFTWQTS
jgi:hypothetical protein